MTRGHKNLGSQRGEYTLLNVANKYLSNRSDNDLTTFVKESKAILFPGWWRKVKMETEIEQAVLDTCFHELAGDLEINS